MTNKEYIQMSVDGVSLNDAALADLFSSTDLLPDDEYSPDSSGELWKAFIPVLGNLILAPYVSSVSESGFSRSWNREKLGNWYLILCRRYGVTVDEDVLSSAGVSMIADKTDMW